jgi:hypothetical protein
MTNTYTLSYSVLYTQEVEAESEDEAIDMVDPRSARVYDVMHIEATREEEDESSPPPSENE